MFKIVAKLLFFMLIFSNIILADTEKEMDKPREIKEDLKIKIWDKKKRSQNDIEKKIIAEYTRIIKTFSAYRPSSIVTKLNQSASLRPVKVTQEVIDIINWASKISEQTKGVFDITTASFRWQYGFGHSDYRVPTALHLDQIKSLVNHKYIVLYKEEKEILFKREGVQIDLEDFINLYALNQIEKILETHKPKGARIEIKEDIIIWGKIDDYLTEIMIFHPEDKKKLITTTTLKTGKLLKIGYCEKSFKHEGERYHTILDARTGRPVKHTRAAILKLPLKSKQVFPPSVLLLLPLSEAMALVEKSADLEAMFITDLGEVKYSKRWKKTKK